MALTESLAGITNRAAIEKIKKQKIEEAKSQAPDITKFVSSTFKKPEAAPGIKDQVEVTTDFVQNTLTKPTVKETFLSAPPEKPEPTTLDEKKEELFWSDPTKYKRIFGLNSFNKYSQRPEVMNKMRVDFAKGLSEEEQAESKFFWQDPEGFQKQFGEDPNKIVSQGSLPGIDPGDVLAGEIRQDLPEGLANVSDILKEDLFQPIGTGLANVGFSIPKTMATLVKIYGEQQPLTGFDVPGATNFSEESLQKLQDSVDFWSAAQQGMVDEFIDTEAQKNVMLLAGGVASLLSGYGIYSATKSINMAAGALSLIESSDIYNEARESGLSPEESLAAFGATLAGTFLLEKVGFHSLIGEGTIVQKFLKEGIQEASQTGWQDVVANYGFERPFSTLSEYWDSFWVGGVTAGGVSMVLDFAGNTPEAKASEELQSLGMSKGASEHLIRDLSLWGENTSKVAMNKLNTQYSFGENRPIGLKGLEGGQVRPGIEVAAPLPVVEAVDQELVEKAKTYDNAQDFVSEQLEVNEEKNVIHDYLAQFEDPIAAVQEGTIEPDPSTFLPTRDVEFAESLGKVPSGGTRTKLGMPMLPFFQKHFDISEMAPIESAQDAIETGEKLGYQPKDIAHYLVRNYVPGGIEFVNGLGEQPNLTEFYKTPSEAELTSIWNQANLPGTQLPSDLAFKTGPEGDPGKRPGIEIAAPIEDSLTPYERNRVVQKEHKVTPAQELKKVVKTMKKSADKFLGSISTRLKNINPKLKFKLRKMEFDTRQAIAKDTKAIEPLLKKTKEMTPDDLYDLDLAFKNGDAKKINELAEKYDMQSEIKSMRKTLDGIYERMKAAGFNVGYLKNYAPRVVKDTEGFLTYLKGQTDWPIIQKAIQEKEATIKRNLSDEEKAQFVNTLLRGYSGGGITLSQTGAMKARGIDTVTPELNRYYMDTGAALARYLRASNEAITARQFFGKHAKGEEINLEDSIGSFTLDLIAEGKITPEQEVELSQILRARFNPKGTSGLTGIYKNLSYIDTMGSFSSAITQIGDLAFPVYKNGIKRTTGALYKAATGKPIISREDLGIKEIIAEFEDSTKTSNAVSKVFKLVGLETMDALGKETFIGSRLAQLQKDAQAGKPGLAESLRPVFEGETEGVIQDLKDEVVSENVKLLIFNELLDVQPIALSEMPEAYLVGGNGRIFYMLKSYTLKLFDVYRNDIVQEIAKGDKESVVRGTKNMIRLGAALMIMNATADLLKDLLLGREVDLEDTVVDNIFKLFGVSKYVTWQARTEGIGSAIVKQIAPPFKFLDALYRDVGNLFTDLDALEEGSEVVSSIPIAGKLYYWWFGKGAAKTEKRRDKITSIVEEKIGAIEANPELTREQIDATLDDYVLTGEMTEAEAEAVKGEVLYKYGITIPKYEQVLEMLGRIETTPNLTKDAIDETLSDYVRTGELTKKQKTAIKQLLSKDTTSSDEMSELKEFKDTGKKKTSEDKRGIFELAGAYWDAFGADPANAWKALTTKEKLGLVEGNLVELKRFFDIGFDEAGGSQETKKRLMEEEGLSWSDRDDYKLDHTIPVSAGGDNSDENLLLVPTDLHKAYSAVEINVAIAMKDEAITRKDAEKIMTDLKVNKTITIEEALEELDALIGS